MSVEKNIKEILKELPSTTKLVAVSKFMPDELILEAYKAGQRDFGESRPQELAGKMERLPSDIRWHFIGPLQTNKIKMIIEKVYLIHSVDSIKLIKEISKEALKKGVSASILLQQHISNEDTKQGFSSDEMRDAALIAKDFGNIRVKGLMGMASFTEDMYLVKREFTSLKDSFNSLKLQCFSDDSDFSEISMGMSGDYRIAVEEGSTMVRIGTRVFGTRIY
ncbi:MAG: YggS family pyridoxal phosphate-dependent enzyme [Bacteroidales bacterium]|nr:YggS family pyridoxal phosphate-dependent enzyme [Bacteroidales bacterium]MDD4057289.1 YggS family pyridoxal phosphate-dependent enzyme [Bacteroidales bacterium]